METDSTKNPIPMPTDSIPRPTATDIRPHMGTFPPDLKSYKAVIKWNETMFSQYNTYDARLQTFNRLSLAKPAPQQLSAAGFSHTGML
jgi:hypothetical protein